MIIGFVGIGKMGHNMVLNLLSKNIKVAAYNKTPEKTKELVKKGIIPAFSLKELVFQLPSNKKVIWLMVPPESVDITIGELRLYLTKGDTIIDGGNSFYKNSIRRAKELKEKGINFLDVGTNSGVEGALNGASLTVGGEKKIFDDLRLLFSSLAAKEGYTYVGSSGAGHYVKMVHNMIEYGIMQAIGEGFESLKHSDFEFDMAEIARTWNNGSVIRSYLMELVEKSFKKDKNLSHVESYVSDSGEGKWAIEDALERNTPVPSSALALMVRYKSRDNDPIAEKLIASLRNEFGGHGVFKVIEDNKTEKIKQQKIIIKSKKNKRKKKIVKIKKVLKKKKIVKKTKRKR